MEYIKYPEEVKHDHIKYMLSCARCNKRMKVSKTEAEQDDLIVRRLQCVECKRTVKDVVRVVEELI